jgi:MFS family permease
MADAPSIGTGWFHPSRRPFRFTVLLFVSLLTYGSYFAYDSVGAIPDQLMKAWAVDQTSIGKLYSIYSLAAILTLFLGGLLIDRVGTRKASLLFSGLVTAGAAIVAFAPSIGVAYVGRFLFGWGSESLVVAQSAILSRWFKGKELALSFGVALTISRLGTLFTFNTEALIAERTGYHGALWAAVAFCAVSLLGNLVYVAMDIKGQRSLGLKDGSAGDKIVLADATRFRPSYWYVTLMCVTFYSAIFPFTALSTDFFHEKFGLPMTAGSSGGFLAGVFSSFAHMFSTAPGTSSIIIFASMVFAPFAGGLVDRIGRRASLMVFGSLLMIPCYLLLAFTALPPAIPMVLLGASFVLVPAAMWPSVPLIVEKQRVGTAFGLMTMVQNVGLMTFPWLNGKLRVLTHDYAASMMMFAALGAAGFVFSLLLLGADRRGGHILERPEDRSAG